MIRNVHERELPVPAEQAGALLDTAGGPRDALWPAPAWVPMELEMPLRVGSAGGHGPIRYRVTGYRPGRMLEFTLDPGQGLHGTHTFTVEPLGPTRCRIRHEIDGSVSGLLRVLWPLVVRPQHDAVLEDLLDRAERVLGCPHPVGSASCRPLGTGPARPARWTPWVRLLRRLGERPRVRAVTPASDGLLGGALDRVDASDAYAVDVPAAAPHDPRWWAERLFADPPGWVAGLLALRERLVGLVGIERAARNEFDVLSGTDDEVLLGADAGHLDFRASVRREPGRVVLGTVVALRNRRGRLYWSVVRLVHPVVVRAILARAVRRARRCTTGGPGFRPATADREPARRP